MNFYVNDEYQITPYLANIKYGQANKLCDLNSNIQQLAGIQLQQSAESYYNQYLKIADETSKNDASSAFILLSTINSSLAEKEDIPKTFAIKKRTRKMFSQAQIKTLENIFDQMHYPDSTTRINLSSKLNLNVARIQVWFQNRRAKYRKMDAFRARNGK